MLRKCILFSKSFRVLYGFRVSIKSPLIHYKCFFEIIEICGEIIDINEKLLSNRQFPSGLYLHINASSVRDQSYCIWAVSART